MKIKVTIEVQGTFILNQKEIDEVVRAISMGVLAKYSGRIESMTDNSVEQLYGSTRTKLFVIADEERKEVPV